MRYCSLGKALTLVMMCLVVSGCALQSSYAEPTISSPMPTRIRPTSVPTSLPTSTAIPLPAPTVTPAPTLASTRTPMAPVDAQPVLSTTVTLTPEVFMPSVVKDWMLEVYETQVVLTSYGWEQALRPSTPDKPYYPYPELDLGAVGPPELRTYDAVILENSYVRITVLPYFGGRILRWEDKVTGHKLTYENPVIKPTHWGYRGWWLAMGGLEWAFPVDEHGLNEYRPWQYELHYGEDWRGVRVWDTDDRTDMQIEITLRLYGGRSDLVIAPRLTNPTAEDKPLMFWINAMLTLSGENHPSSALRFWVPTVSMMVHSTGDPSLPGPRGTMSWPVHNGRDFSYYSQWRQYLGLFAWESTGAMGAYDENADQGMVRVYPAAAAPGVKIFCLGDLPAHIYTDDGSRYFEIWGGYNRSFFPEHYVSLGAGRVLAWEEHWYPIHGIGTLGWANNDLAAALKVTEQGISVGLYASRSLPVNLILKHNGAIVAEFAVAPNPGEPFRQIVPGSGPGWVLEVWQAGVLLAQVTP
ncbi:MAG: DUF5107 domain-containing protein [Anaerolineae bacterium]|nr:DUF5107 domain-containing protein [Anaerolineae bacterium]